MDDDSEKRLYFRLFMTKPLPCHVNPHETATFEILDLSGNGCQVRSNLDLLALPVPCRVRFRFRDQPFDLPGEVKWKRETRMGLLVYGIAFVDLITADEERLVSALFQEQRERIRIPHGPLGHGRP